MVNTCVYTFIYPGNTGIPEIHGHLTFTSVDSISHCKTVVDKRLNQHEQECYTTGTPLYR